MATHRRKTHTKRRFGVVAALAAGLMVLSGSLFGPPVDAAITLTPKQKILTLKNADQVATCKFQANRVTPNFVRYTLTASARPSSIDGYRANVWNEVKCYVLPAGDTDINNAIISFTASKNGATMLPENTKGAVPYFSAYTLCGSAEVKKKNGDSTFSPLECK
jgi:hypothetical protein